MELLNSGGGIGAISVLLNLVVLIMQAKQSAATAELKVYMHENFVRKQREVIRESI